MYIEHTYRNVTIPVCTELCDWIWDAERGLRLAETGLQLHAGTGSFLSYPSNSVEKLPHETWVLVWGHDEQERITKLHCTCLAFHASSWSGHSTSGGDHACRSASYDRGWALGGHPLYQDHNEPRWILSEGGATRVCHQQPWCCHRWVFNIGCDLGWSVAWWEGYNLQVRSLDTHTENRHAAQDDVTPGDPP